MALVCVTAVLFVEALLNALLSYTLTPLATSPSEEFTMLTPLAPMRDVPERFTVPVLFSLTGRVVGCDRRVLFTSGSDFVHLAVTQRLFVMGCFGLILAVSGAANQKR